MGELKVRIKVCNPDVPDRCEELKALVDTGASRSVIPRSVMERLGVVRQSRPAFLERRRFPVYLLPFHLEAPGCEVHPALAVGDDALAARAGPDAEMIVGHDHLQRVNANLQFSPREGEDKMHCVPGRRPRLSGKSSPRPRQRPASGRRR